LVNRIIPDAIKRNIKLKKKYRELRIERMRKKVVTIEESDEEE
jgi:hypothetical protein